ncbi:uncharacterized protein LOC121377482 [Gigantopelta aegis]|uniref:uncharacterized protein LOC121377482 n=1 Tax=Gigantopelta aegis TaxID=1735272 RepID=UPI001B88C68E|nr:uncharacterized protein LOC121377482 [Gigantopelta aegis]XP_041361429.1 uncharacterized protein LOC121377482 [Gigantopelta aegis]
MNTMNTCVLFLRRVARTHSKLENIPSKSSLYFGYSLFFLGNVFHTIAMSAPHWADGAHGHVGLWVICNRTSPTASCHTFPKSEEWIIFPQIFAVFTLFLSLLCAGFIISGFVKETTLPLVHAICNLVLFAGFCSIVSVIYFLRRYNRLGKVAEYAGWAMKLESVAGSVLLVGGMLLFSLDPS